MILFLKCVLIISLILNAFLLYKSVRTNKGIGQISEILTEIRSAGFNRRIHFGNKFRSLEALSSEINILMDKFQYTLEEKQRLELSHKQLITNISHDIRTPLTSLLGFVEVLQKNDNIGSEEQKEYLNIINTKGQYLYKMIQEFFELSRLEAEDVTIKLERICLTDVVNDTVAAFYEDFVSAGIIPELQIPAEEVYVWGHMQSTERILHNLLANALKYGRDGGVVGITFRDETDKVLVEVWDKGTGIPERDLPFIFNRLYTTEASRSEKLRGTGLGLAIVKQLVEKQNGEVTVSSTPGDKTIFSFSLIKC